MVAISYNNANNLNRLHAESLVNGENRPEKKIQTQQNRVKGINLISLNYTLQQVIIAPNWSHRLNSLT